MRRGCAIACALVACRAAAPRTSAHAEPTRAPAGIAPPPPDRDSDRDGRRDADDACPLQPETYEGSDDTDGCPDATSSVRFSTDGTRIELLAPVVWRDRTSGVLAEDVPIVLRDLAALLIALPELAIEVRAHEPRRDQAYGMSPTDRQAESIARWLVERGIDPDRVAAEGYGATQPLAPDSPEGREQNARIEVWLR